MRIRRGLSSRVLACGCVVGIYETYAGAVVTIVDERTASCTDAAHATGKQIPVVLSDAAAPARPEPT